jgi:hypothetical protein
MQLRHISPGSSDWVDAMDEERGGRGWEKPTPEELTKLRASEQQETAMKAPGAETTEGAGARYG